MAAPVAPADTESAEHDSQWADRFDPWDPDGMSDESLAEGDYHPAAALAGTVTATGIIEHATGTDTGEAADELDADLDESEYEEYEDEDGELYEDDEYYDEEDDGEYHDEEAAEAAASWSTLSTKGRVAVVGGIAAAAVLVVLLLVAVAGIVTGGGGGVDTVQEPTSSTGAPAPAAEEAPASAPLAGKSISDAIADGSIIGNSSIDNPTSTPDAVMRAVVVAVRNDDADLLSSVLAEDARLGEITLIVGEMSGQSADSYIAAQGSVDCNAPEGAGVADCNYEAGFSLSQRAGLVDAEGVWRLQGYALGLPSPDDPNEGVADENAGAAT